MKVSNEADQQSRLKSREAKHGTLTGGSMSSSLTRESPTEAGSRPETPQWKRQLIKKKGEEKSKLPKLPGSRDRVGNMPGSSERNRDSSPTRTRDDTSAIKGRSGGPIISKRNGSKPMPGAIKAMAALFDHAVKTSPVYQTPTLTGRNRRSTLDRSAKYDVDESPSKHVQQKCPFVPNEPSKNVDDAQRRRMSAQHGSPRKSTSVSGSPHAAQLARDHQITQRSSSRTGTNLSDQPPGTTGDHRLMGQASSSTTRGATTPSAGPSRALHPLSTTKKQQDARPKPSSIQSLRDSLRPVKNVTALKKEPQGHLQMQSADESSAGLPSLGTMVPHQEEPPVGQFMRPSSAISTSQNYRYGRADAMDHAEVSTRQISGNSTGTGLYAQIRALQRLVEFRNEEVSQLRRQLETQSQMDIGTLSEQLREAKRECAMWRKRAESAERRCKVLMRFTGKSGEIESEDGGSVHTETGETVRDRIRYDIERKGKGKERQIARPGLGPDGSWDGAVFDDDFGFDEAMGWR
ncbi:hypothetical protein F5Y18DRAFT_160424 [Xylariaceae sp. FL1019]|nr:hypothetical protein F5Y18DRAFT_160424 [Xylariaceae sp. FL1019]